MATELSSTTITNILEAVPGIKNVLRSPSADAMVNLTRAAAGLGSFDLKDARELMRFAFRRGLISNEEHDRVLEDVEAAAEARHARLVARQASASERHKAAVKAKGRRPRKPAAKKPVKKVVKKAAKKVVKKPAKKPAAKPKRKRATLPKRPAPKPRNTPVRKRPAGPKKASKPKGRR